MEFVAAANSKIGLFLCINRDNFAGKFVGNSRQHFERDVLLAAFDTIDCALRRADFFGELGLG